MVYAKFLGTNKCLACEISVQDEVVDLIFEDDVKPNTNGFNLYTQPDGEGDIGGDYYHDFTTVYKVVSEKEFMLSKNGSVWAPKTSFMAVNGGSLEGQTEFEVYNYEDLEIPTPIAEENYVFDSWNPEIPAVGVIESNRVFTAKFEYVPPAPPEPTVDEIRARKIAELSATCEQIIEAGADILTNGELEHFSYAKSTDQSNIKELFDLATSTNMAQFYHCDNGTCRAYSVEEIIAIYGAECFNKNTNETYFNQSKQYLNTVEDKDVIEAFEYGTELPVPYSSVISLSRENATAVLLKRIEGLEVDIEAIMTMIMGGQKPVAGISEI